MILVLKVVHYQIRNIIIMEVKSALILAQGNMHIKMIKFAIKKKIANL
jgi:hypothetical protein